MEATQPARLGDFEFDAIIKRPETLSSKIPDYATEEGYSASDHICLEAVTLDVTAVISNAPITWADRHPASSSRVQSAVEELRQLWEKRMPMTFTAGGDSYENVCIESVTFPKEESNSERIELKLKQVSINSTETANISIDDYVKVESREDKGNYRASKIRFIGDTEGDDWQCVGQFVEVK